MCCACAPANNEPRRGHALAGSWENAGQTVGESACCDGRGIVAKENGRACGCRWGVAELGHDPRKGGKWR